MLGPQVCVPCKEFYTHTTTYPGPTGYTALASVHWACPACGRVGAREHALTISEELLQEIVDKVATRKAAEGKG